MAHIHHEMGLHIEYCKKFGVSKEEIEATEESQGMKFKRDVNEANQISSMHGIYKVLYRKVSISKLVL